MGMGSRIWALGEMVRQRFGIPEDAPSQRWPRGWSVVLGSGCRIEADRAFVSPRLGALFGGWLPGLDRPELFAGWRLFFERLAGA